MRLLKLAYKQTEIKYEICGFFMLLKNVKIIFIPKLFLHTNQPLMDMNQILSNQKLFLREKLWKEKKSSKSAKDKRYEKDIFNLNFDLFQTRIVLFSWCIFAFSVCFSVLIFKLNRIIRICISGLNPIKL